MPSRFIGGKRFRVHLIHTKFLTEGVRNMTTRPTLYESLPNTFYLPSRYHERNMIQQTCSHHTRLFCIHYMLISTLNSITQISTKYPAHIHCLDTIQRRDIHRFIGGKVILAMEGHGADGRVICEDRSGSIPLVNVTVYHRHLPFAGARHRAFKSVSRKKHVPAWRERGGAFLIFHQNHVALFPEPPTSSWLWRHRIVVALPAAWIHHVALQRVYTS